MYKVEIDDNVKVTFAPVVLNVTITSEEELMTLWHIFNSANKAFEVSTSTSGGICVPVQSDTRSIWKSLDELVRRLKVKYGK